MLPFFYSFIVAFYLLMLMVALTVLRWGLKNKRSKSQRLLQISVGIAGVIMAVAELIDIWVHIVS